MNKTSLPPIDSIDRQWYLVDAENQTLGRLATEVASILRGKNNPSFTPHLDTGDFVVVVNAEKIQVSGKKPLRACFPTTPWAGRCTASSRSIKAPSIPIQLKSPSPFSSTPQLPQNEQ